MLGGGDKLAGGSIRATFTAGKIVSDKRWSDAFDDLDLVRFNGGLDESSNEAAVESDNTVKGNTRLREVVKK